MVCWCDFCVADVVLGEVKMFGNSVTSIAVNVESVCVFVCVLNRLRSVCDERETERERERERESEREREGERELEIEKGGGGGGGWGGGGGRALLSLLHLHIIPLIKKEYLITIKHYHLLVWFFCLFFFIFLFFFFLQMPLTRIVLHVITSIMFNRLDR